MLARSNDSTSAIRKFILLIIGELVDDVVRTRLALGLMVDDHTDAHADE